MKIFNTTTNEVETLTYYDRSQNASQQQDSSADVTAGDPNITFDPNEGHYQASGEAIDYWRQWFAKSETADDLERELRQMARGKGLDWIRGRITEVNQEAGWSGFDDVPAERIKAFEALRAEIEADPE
jgi:hypothetical protein